VQVHQHRVDDRAVTSKVSTVTVERWIDPSEHTHPDPTEWDVDERSSEVMRLKNSRCNLLQPGSQRRSWLGGLKERTEDSHGWQTRLKTRSKRMISTLYMVLTKREGKGHRRDTRDEKAGHGE
jgi:hypothetical protein